MPRSTLDKAIVVTIGVLVLALAWVIVKSMQEHITEAGDRAPDFTLTTDHGLKITPTNFGGKVLVLNFWATWCAPCVEEVPSLVQFDRALSGSGVVVLGVSVDTNEKRYAGFLKRYHVSFLTSRDPSADISAEYGTYKVPETYIIDKNGRVAQKIIGPRNWTDPDLINYVKSLL